MFPLLRNDETFPDRDCESESSACLICSLTLCTHHLSLLTSHTITFSFLRSWRLCSHKNIQHITNKRAHTVTNTYTHIKVILCRLIVIHCGYGNQMPFPSQFSSVVFLSLPNLCVQIPPTSTSHLWSSVPAHSALITHIPVLH